MGTLTGKRRLEVAKKLLRRAIKDYNRADKYSRRKAKYLKTIDRLCDSFSKEDRQIHAIELEKIERDLNKYSV